MTKEYISCNDAAELLNVTPRAVCKLCDSKKLYAVKTGKKWQVAEESVLYYLSSKNMKKRLPCPVGKTSYKAVSQECYYVDKTLLVRDILDEQNQVILFTRPRRFGKTMALDMLRTFFEKSEEDTSVYFSKRLIWKCGRTYTAEQAQYPVIYLNFKDNKYKNWEDTFAAIKLALQIEGQRHSYLLTSTALDDIDKQFLQGLLQQKLSFVEYNRSLLSLCKILEKYHQHKVMIMIDEYDTPIQQGFLGGFYEDVINFMRNFLSSCLKDNDALARGFLTGILRISKENLFSGLNNITVNTLLDERYSEYFGFTENDIQKLLHYYGKASKLEEVKAWYDGYRFGEREIYNPWSVTSYISDGCQPKAFWANTSENGIIKSILQAADGDVVRDLQSLFLDEIITAKLDLNVIYPKLNANRNIIYSFLLLTGYLKIVRHIAEDVYQLQIPNHEVKSIYRKEILAWVGDKTEKSVADDLRIAVLTEEYGSMARLLESYLLAAASFMDTSKEVFYHGLILGLAAAVSDKFYIRSNRESGQGRFDISLEPRDNKAAGIILEIKAVSKAESLAEKSQEALEQISCKNYLQELRERGIKRIIACGIAFCGKSCHSSVNHFDEVENG